MSNFKNAIAYTLHDTFSMTAQKIEATLYNKEIRQISAQESAIMGVSKFCKSSQNLSYCNDNNNVFIKLTKKERILPASVINDEVENKIDLIKSEQNREVTRKEKTEIKDDVTLLLMPRAFVKSTDYTVLISLKEKRLIINSASGTIADDINSILRECFGALAITPISATHDFKGKLVSWMESVPVGFDILEEFELKRQDDSQSKIKNNNMPLRTSQTQEYLDEGLVISQLRVCFDDSIECTIRDDSLISKIKFSDSIDDKAYDNEYDELAANCFINSSVLNKLFDNLEEIFKVQ